MTRWDFMTMMEIGNIDMPQIELMSGEFRLYLSPNAIMHNASGYLMFAKEADIGQLIYSRTNKYVGIRVK